MGIKTYLLAVVLALRALASPIEGPPAANSENWTILSFRRACVDDQSRCDYSFLVSENPEKAPKYCGFAIDAVGRLPAYQVGFSVAKCPVAPEYSVNGGWDNRGFVTLTVINNKRNLLSFFSFKDDDLANGVEATPQHSKVFSNPMPVKRGEMEGDQHQDLAYASEWKLVDVVRYVINQGLPYSESVILSFSIEGANAPSEACLLQIPRYKGEMPLTNSFYDQECGGSGGWRISWGQDEDTDEAVMTLVNKYHDRHAFFGFNQVSHTIVLGTNGPNPTEPLL